jgi:hypothetical protein
MAANRGRVSAKEAIEVYRRVLWLVDGYMRVNLKQDELVTFDGGLKTWREIRQHIKGARALKVSGK